MATETSKLLDRISAHLGGASDYRIAKELGINKSTVSVWRVGKGSMGDATALKVAEILGEKPGYILALVQSERTDSPEARRIWRTVAASVGGKAAAVLVATLLAGQPTKTQAHTIDLASANCETMYIMSNYLLKLR